MADSAEVAVVGGGPAGAAIAWRLASAGRDVVVLEQAPAWRWRACGVFTSPITVVELRRLGLTADEIDAVARPIPRLWIESPGAPRFALDYGHTAPGTPTAVGLDRSSLDPLLLARAEAAGARIGRGTAVVAVARDGRVAWRLRVRDADGEREIRARVLVGADGIRSRVARDLGVVRPTPLPRVGLTFHIGDGSAAEARSPAEVGSPADVGSAADADARTDGRMVVLPGAYCGLAPVPGGRVNAGIVLASASRRGALAANGAAQTADGVLREAGISGPRAPLDRIAGVAPVAHRVARCAGPGWLLVGDAAGFLDPFTGEGLHRALLSARLGAAAVEAALDGRIDAFADYDAAMRRRVRAKDLVSWVVQAFLAQPALLAYAARRIADRPAHRRQLGLLMGDLVPASGAFDPRFLVGLLAP